MRTTDEDIRAEIRAERSEQAELLAALRPEQWDAESLCAGWRVREVVAHTTMPFRVSTARTLWELVRSGGRMNRMLDRCARRDAARLTSEELVAAVRDNAGHPWQPPGSGPLAPLSHDVIHGLDVSVALGLGRRVPAHRTDLVLSGLAAQNIAFFGADLAGVSLRATDRDWSFGTGTPVFGEAQYLLLVICGRRLPPGHLEGDAAARFTGTPG
ncbi:maleylpyruvate isomerase family mycothiol-dependent enzyme [Actinoplanes aureus]|uniref:Maleylpyruvate isomerase family mycothiol-dependent enzyme n=1 Tax=Actinoplanes aureus TaxID=2792083 RepID=A0A931C542_9ACTN|nr:maleylpyruvate isomerase family mycothiol-dependent enzyme [Actinoplanes aureus]MBG0562399.1 maleylpyruvate isomerase family mycothiol-dependent enzyme [Actinoplanes aureus]